MLADEDKSNWNDVSHCSHRAVQGCHGCSSCHIYHWSALHFVLYLNAILWITTMGFSFLMNLRRGAMGCGFCLSYFFFFLLKTASAFGDPHFLTFDGLNFTFKGQGEYTLVESDLTSLRVQGRTQQVHFPNGKLVREEAAITNNSFWSGLVCTSQHSSYLL